MIFPFSLSSLYCVMIFPIFVARIHALMIYPTYEMISPLLLALLYTVVNFPARIHALIIYPTYEMISPFWLSSLTPVMTSPVVVLTLSSTVSMLSLTSSIAVWKASVALLQAVFRIVIRESAGLPFASIILKKKTSIAKKYTDWIMDSILGCYGSLCQ